MAGREDSGLANPPMSYSRGCSHVVALVSWGRGGPRGDERLYSLQGIPRSGGTLVEMEVWASPVISAMIGLSAWVGVWDIQKRMAVVKEVARDMGRIAKTMEKVAEPEAKEPSETPQPSPSSPVPRPSKMTPAACKQALAEWKQAGKELEGVC